MKHLRSTVKVRFRKLKYSTRDYTNLIDSIKLANHIIYVGYMFIRSYVLYIIENNSDDFKQIIEEPIINVNFIRAALSVITLDDNAKKGRPFNNDKTTMINNLTNYFKEFKIITDIESINAKNVSYILGQSYEQMYISIINNIKYHYDKHLWRYIRANFIDEYNNIIDQHKPKLLNDYYTELEKIKNDMYENTLTCHKKYHIWVILNRTRMIPALLTKSTFETDVENNTFSYIKSMWYMNKYIQSKKMKSYQILPIRTSCYNKYVKINTSALIEIFYGTSMFNKFNTLKLNKIDFFKKAGDINFQEQIWNAIFNLKSKGIYNYKLKGYSFNYEIDTDGFAVSLNFINNNEITNKEKQKENFRKARSISALNKKSMNSIEYDQFIKNKIEINKQKIKDEKTLKKQQIEEKKKAFSKLSVEEKENIKNKLNEKSEFPYIEKILTDGQKKESFLEDFETGKILVCDPGKRSPLYFMATNSIVHEPIKPLKKNNFGISLWKGHKIMNYSNKTRLKFIKRMKYSEMIENWKAKKPKYVHKSFKNLEIDLSSLNGKECIHKDFLSYVKKHYEFWTNVNTFYDLTYLQKLNWFSYLNKRKHENELLNHIANEFGSDIKIIIGDWSNKGQLKFISTPNLSLKRKLAERFEVYTIDEYNTSKIHNEYLIECDNLYVKVEQSNELSKNSNDKPLNKNKYYLKKIHSVLTYKLVTSVIGCNQIEMGCLNRDKNSVLNMESIMKSLLESGKRPNIFDRSYNQLIRKVKLIDAKGTNRGKQGTNKSVKTKNVDNKNVKIENDKIKKKSDNQKRKNAKIKKFNEILNELNKKVKNNKLFKK